jgi:P-type Ca2+ transporter type 2C
VPFLAAAFDFTSVELGEYCVAIALGFVVIPVVEAVKFFQRRASQKK